MYILNGIVIQGDQIGRTIGVPTANMAMEKDNSVVPGVYKINIIIDGQVFPGVGTYLEKKGVFESHIFDFSEDIYGKEIEVVLLKKIRNNTRFTSLLELKQQITQDIAYARNTLFHVLTFGAFDFVHEGHKHYLSQARKYGDILITIVGTDENIEKIKGKKPDFPLQTRIVDVEKLGIADKVLAGDKENPLTWIDTFSPEYICLGYDQKGFTHLLETYISEQKIHTEVIILNSHKPEMYKSSLLKKKYS